MPIEVTKIRGGTVAVAYCFGNLTEADVSDSISLAFGSRRIEPSLDRIVKTSPDAELHELDIEALRSIQRRILDQELRSGREACFRSVLVHSSPSQKNLMQLYKAIWDALDLPGVEFFVVASEDEAWRTLGLMPSAFQRIAQ
jgi:hypothetical protein